MSTETENHQPQTSDDLFNTAALDALGADEKVKPTQVKASSGKESKKEVDTAIDKFAKTKTSQKRSLPIKKIFLSSFIAVFVIGSMAGLGYLYLELTKIKESMASVSKERLASNLDMLNSVNENSTLSAENKLTLNALKSRFGDVQYQADTNKTELTKVKAWQSDADSKINYSSDKYTNQSSSLAKLNSDLKAFKASVQRQFRTVRASENSTQLPATKEVDAIIENVYSIDGLELVSIDLYAKYRVAVFIDNKGELIKRMMGEKIGKWRITNIERNKSLVELSHKDKMVYLQLVEG